MNLKLFTGIIMNTARRQSNALSVGSTPLNKVITIILAAQKTSPAYVAHALDEVSKLGYILSDGYLLSEIKKNMK